MLSPGWRAAQQLARRLAPQHPTRSPCSLRRPPRCYAQEVPCVVQATCSPVRAYLDVRERSFVEFGLPVASLASLFHPNTYVRHLLSLAEQAKKSLTYETVGASASASMQARRRASRGHRCRRPNCIAQCQQQQRQAQGQRQAGERRRQQEAARKRRGGQDGSGDPGAARRQGGAACGFGALRVCVRVRALCQRSGASGGTPRDREWGGGWRSRDGRGGRWATPDVDGYNVWAQVGNLAALAAPRLHAHFQTLESRLDCLQLAALVQGAS
jgi:hypothetical protein